MNEKLVSAVEYSKALLLHKQRTTTLGFTRATKSDYDINWHHKIITNKLDDLLNNKIKRLMFFLPPRTGKSELISRRFPALSLGRFPDLSIIGTSYSADLASRLNRDVQRVMSDPVYEELFPESRLFGKNIRSVAQGSWLRNSDIFEIVGKKGVYRSSGIGGGITGMGMHIGIIDDPIKDQKEADSPTFRQNVWDWYCSTFLTRLEKDGRILITLTRWHEDDLAGRILAQKNHGFEVVSFPMIKEEDDPLDPRQIGEPLWAEKYDLQACMEIKRQVGSRVWNALYQQRPTALEGGIFKRDWFQYYDAPPIRFDEIVDSWDLTFKGSNTSDFVVGQKWGRKGGNFYLLALIRGRMNFPQAIEAIRALRTKGNRLPNAILIEDKANGPATIAMLSGEVPGVVAFNPDTSKESRANAVSPLFEAKNIFLPRGAEWLSDYVEEMCNFPHGRHDDQVDATTQALLRLAHFGDGDFTKEMADSGVETIASSMRSQDQW